MTGRQNESQGLFMISVAATLAGVHPQTLRIYEQRRLIEPQRTAKGTRLYSQENVDRLRRIQELTEEGLSLAGVERVFELEDTIARLNRRVAALERRLQQTELEAAQQIREVERRHRAEIVPYRPPVIEMTVSRPRPEPAQRIPITKADQGSQPKPAEPSRPAVSDSQSSTKE